MHDDRRIGVNADAQQFRMVFHDAEQIELAVPGQNVDIGGRGLQESEPALEKIVQCTLSLRIEVGVSEDPLPPADEPDTDCRRVLTRSSEPLGSPPSTK